MKKSIVLLLALSVYFLSACVGSPSSPGDEKAVSTIADVLENRASGDAARIRGIVYAIDDEGFYLTDETERFMYVRSPDNLTRGDTVDVQGRYHITNQRPELRDATIASMAMSISLPSYQALTIEDIMALSPATTGGHWYTPINVTAVLREDEHGIFLADGLFRLDFSPLTETLPFTEQLDKIINIDVVLAHYQQAWRLYYDETKPFVVLGDADDLQALIDALIDDIESRIAALPGVPSFEDAPDIEFIREKIDLLESHGVGAETITNYAYFLAVEEALEHMYLEERTIHMSLRTLPNPGPDNRQSSWLVDFMNPERWKDDYTNRSINGETFESFRFYDTSHSHLDTQPQFMQFDISYFHFDTMSGHVGISDFNSNTTYPLEFVIYGDGDVLFETILHHGEDAHTYALDVRGVEWIRLQWSAETVSPTGFANRIVLTEPIFSRTLEHTVTETVLREGTLEETPLYRLDTGMPGPTLFIVAGIHGNERAGWMTALAMLGWTFESGVIYILPRAHMRATKTYPPVRHPAGEEDLNRVFPGNPSGSSEERLAYDIFQAMLAAEPDYVFDLHESRGSRLDGNLGDSIIIHSNTHYLFLQNILDEFNTTFDPDVDFVRLAAHSAGLINVEFTQASGVPVFTFETNRGGNVVGEESISLTYRIAQQTALMRIFIEHIWDASLASEVTIQYAAEPEPYFRRKTLYLR